MSEDDRNQKIAGEIIRVTDRLMPELPTEYASWKSHFASMDFHKIARTATEDELHEIIEDCKHSTLEEIRCRVRSIYENELQSRQARAQEVDFWEGKYQGERVYSQPPT